jgi:beta-lactamase regulating signal transducer with metallopeptidase domain/Skp family chaperone for outer membrane proteins
MNTLLLLGLSNALAALILAVPAALVSRLMRRPALAHVLWLLVLLKLVTPPLLFWPISWPRAEPRAESPPKETKQADEVVNPEPIELVVMEEAPVEWMPVELATPAAEPTPPLRIDVETALAGIWLSGAVIWFFLAAYRVGRFRRELRRGIPASAELRDRVKELSNRLGLRLCPEVVLVKGRIPPMLWWVGGIPTLIVPASLIASLSGDALETVLLHELAHYRRRDHWVRMLELMVTGLYWWNPVVWYARRELREAEEQCCDAWVVTALPGSARTYATALVETLDFLAGAGAAPLGASGVGPVSDLKRRLTMILRDVPPRSLSWAAVMTVLGAAGLVLPVLPVWAQDAAKPVKVIFFGEKPDEPKKKVVEGDGEEQLKALEAELQQKLAELEKARATLLVHRKLLEAKRAEAKEAMDEEARRKVEEARKSGRKGEEAGRGAGVELRKVDDAIRMWLVKPEQPEGVRIEIVVSGEVDPEAVRDWVKKIEAEAPWKGKSIAVRIHKGKAEGGGLKFALVPPNPPAAPKLGARVPPTVLKPVTPGEPPVLKQVGPGAAFRIEGIKIGDMVKPGESSDRINALEKKFDAVLKELEAMRREMKERK